MSEEKKQTIHPVLEQKSNQPMPDVVALAKEALAKMDALAETEAFKASSADSLEKWQKWRDLMEFTFNHKRPFRQFDTPTTKEPLATLYLNESLYESLIKESTKRGLDLHTFEKFFSLEIDVFNREAPSCLTPIIDEFFEKAFQSEGIQQIRSALRSLMRDSGISSYMPAEAVSKLFRFFPAKTQLEFYLDPYSLENSGKILNTLPPRIYHLRLTTTQLEHLAATLTRAINALAPSITELDLSKLELNRLPIASMKAIMKMLSESNVLSLNLAENRIANFLESTTNVFEPLKQSKIRILNLEGNALGKEKPENIIKLLEQTPAQLKYLDLSYTQLDEPQITEEALTAILQSSTASYINLSGNFEMPHKKYVYITEEETYSAAISENKSLRELEREKEEKATETHQREKEALWNKVVNAICASGKTVILEDDEFGRAVKERVEAIFEMLKGMDRRSGSPLYTAFSKSDIYEPRLRAEILKFMGFTRSTNAKVTLVKSNNDPTLLSLIASLQSSTPSSEHKGDRKKALQTAPEDKAENETPTSSTWDDFSEAKKPVPKMPSAAPSDSLTHSQASETKKTSHSKPGFARHKLEEYFTTKADTKDDALLARDISNNLGQDDTTNLTTVSAAVQILQTFGLGPDWVWPIVIDKLDSLPQALKQKNIPPGVRYLPFVIPTHDGTHAVAAVVDKITNTIYAIDSEMNTHGNAADTLQTQLEKLTGEKEPLEGFKVSMPAADYPVQQTDDTSCGTYACMNLVGIILGLRWRSSESLEDALQQNVDEVEQLSPEALAFIRHIYINIGQNWQPNSSNAMISKDIYKLAMLRANRDVITDGNQLHQQQLELKTARDNKAPGDTKSGTGSADSALLTTGYDRYSVFTQTSQQSAAAQNTNSDNVQSAADAAGPDQSPVAGGNN